MQGSTSQVTRSTRSNPHYYQSIPQVKRNPPDVTASKHKVLQVLKAYQDEHGLSNKDLAKALNYNELYIFERARKLSAIDFVDSSDINKAFKSLKSFSVGKAVNRIKPKSKDILSASMDLIRIGTDHKDNQESIKHLTLNLNVLKGLEPDNIAADTLDDRQIIDANDAVVIKDMCVSEVQGIQDLRIDNSNCYDFLE
jgi:hypothetical protein